MPAQFDEAELVAVEIQGFIDIGDADHRVQIFHQRLSVFVSGGTLPIRVCKGQCEFQITNVLHPQHFGKAVERGEEPQFRQIRP
jgi:hypothetical protein